MDRVWNATPVRPASPAFTWLVVGLATWIVAGVYLVVWAGDHGLVPDIGASPYHLPGWLGLAALAVLCAIRLGGAVRRRVPLSTAFPTGYGVLGSGFIVLLAYLVVDVAWREGVGIVESSLEGGVAPSRILLEIGLLLVVAGPFRAGLSGQTSRSARLAAIPSAALALGLLGLPRGFDPMVNPRLEQPPLSPQAASEIWVMDAEGRHQERLLEAADGIELGWPAWSPDRTQIVYARWVPGDPPDDVSRRDVDIWVAAADGTNARRLVGGPGWQWMPRWSPDGRWIAYTEEAAGGPWLATGPQGPDSGPQGQGFGAGTATVRADADIWRIHADGSGTPERLTGGPGDDRSAAWSPDGTRLALDSTRDGNTEIYLMNADGTNPIRLTTDPAADWAASWSPSGTELAFTSSRDSLSDIFVAPAAGGNARRLTDGFGWAKGPVWSPDGTRIAFDAQDSAGQQIWSIGLDGSAARDLSRSPGSFDDIWDGRWAGDGRLIFSRNGSPPAIDSGLVREDMAALMVLFRAILLAGAVAVILRIRPPFGSFATIFGIAGGLVAVSSDQWRYIPAAILVGLAVDLVIRYAPTRLRSGLGAATAGSAFVVAMALATSLTSGLEWSPTILVGLVGLAGFLGLLVGTVVAAPFVPLPARQVVEDAATHDDVAGAGGELAGRADGDPSAMPGDHLPA